MRDRIRSRAALAAATVVVAIVLSGCVSIPTSGGVNTGGRIDEQVGPDFVVLPSDPRAGSTQEELLADFMQAVRGPQNGYAVAKKFLTAGLRETWQPDAGALIRGQATEPVIQPAGQDTLGYTVEALATVNSLGQYTEQSSPGQQTLAFGFAKENGEWRISQLADGIVLSQRSFTVAFREQALYFFDPSYAYLVPDVRWFAARQNPAARVTEALLAGPSPWLGQAVTTAFPAATTLGPGTVSRRSGGVVVDLSAEALGAGPNDRDRMQQQLAATLDSPNVELTVRGLGLTSTDSTATRAAIDPGVADAALVGAAGSFGFDGGTGIAPLPGLSDKVVGLGATGGDLSADRQAIAVLTGTGEVALATASAAQPTIVDPRPGLAVPAIDPFRYIWSGQAQSAATLTTHDTDGTERPVQTGLAPDSAIVSLDVSRDGTRLLIALSTPAGAQLLVFGIVRQNAVPTRLSGPLALAAGAVAASDATWVDERTVATVSADGEVTTYPVGGPRASLGQASGGRTIAGGNGGADGLRVLSSDGNVWRRSGTSGWVKTGITASFLATKQ